MSKTTTLHVYHTFLYISFPFLHDYGVKMPNFAFNRERTSTSTLFNKNIDYNRLARKIAIANLVGPVKRKIE